MEKLKKLLEKENKKQVKEALQNLKNASAEDITNLWYYKNKLTNNQIKKYNNIIEKLGDKDSEVIISKRNLANEKIAKLKKLV